MKKRKDTVKRRSIYLPEWLDKTIAFDASVNFRSFTKQIEYILREHYRNDAGGVDAPSPYWVHGGVSLRQAWTGTASAVTTRTFASLVGESE